MLTPENVQPPVTTVKALRLNEIHSLSQLEICIDKHRTKIAFLI